MTSDFWSSPEGLEIRLEDLAESLTWESINKTLEVLGEKVGVQRLEWVSEIDDRTCNYCDGQSGRTYEVGGLLPAMPAHPHCRCHWEIVY